MNSKTTIETSRVWVLKERSEKFLKYVMENIKTQDDVKKLKNISIMSLDRTIWEISGILENLENQPNVKWFTINIREALRNLVIWLNEALEECNRLLKSSKEDNEKDFLSNFIKINLKLESIFQYINKVNEIISNKIIAEEVSEKKNPALIWFRNALNPVINLVKRVSKWLIIWTTAWSLLATPVQATNIPQTREWNARLIQGIITQEKTKIPSKEEFIKALQDNPKELERIPNFKEKIWILVWKLKKDEIFNPKNYKRWETWKMWNDEIIRIFYPTYFDNFSFEEKQIIIKALQEYYKAPTKDGQFWRSSREHLIKVFSQKHQAKKSTESIVQKPKLWPLKHQPKPEIVIKRITINEFEDFLFSLKWTKFISWIADCSWMLFKSFYRLWLIDMSKFLITHRWSASIMKQLTINLRDSSTAKRWDFIYWNSSKYEWSSHIWYIAWVKEDWVRIFDRSSDVWEASLRFFTWERLAMKKDCVVWKPIFLI